MNDKHIRDQSNAALKQWKDLWEKHCKIHANDSCVKNDLHDFEFSGIGKAALLVANGYSLEENIETIKEYQNNVDIICCDKSLGHLINNGIKPKFCVVCDASVDYDNYLKPYEDKLEDTILLINVCANPEWSINGNWKNKYFFVNKDIIDSQKEFSRLSGCTNFIPAGTNVSNAMMIMLTQCDNSGKRNFFGYDKFLLIGYDYSWRHGGKYYAYNEDGNGKANYMRHIYAYTVDRDYCYTSGNLYFSKEWLEKYISTYHLPVVNGTKKTILGFTKYGDLKEEMQYNFKREDSSNVKDICYKLRAIYKQKDELEKQLLVIEKEHSRRVLLGA